MLGSNRPITGLIPILLTTMVTAAPLVALDPAVAPADYSIRLWTTHDGLPQNTVQSILQGHHGYLWMATQEGLARFDGVTFRVWDTHSDPPLPARNVRALLEDRHHRLWIGLRGGGGLARLDPDGILHTDFFADAPTTEVRCLFEDPSGTLWIGTRGQGLHRLEPGADQPEPVESVSSTQILNFETDGKGDLWIATEGDGIWRSRSEGFEHLTTADGLPHNNIWDIYRDTSDRLWIGTFGGGLARYEDGRFHTMTIEDGLSSNRITNLCEDRDHNLWIGTYRGLNRLNGRGPGAITREQGLGADIISSVFEDREGNLWVGTAAAGVVRLKDSPFTLYDSSADGLGGMPRVMLEEPGRGVWVGTSNGGLQLIRNGTVMPPPGGADPPEKDVFALHLATDGALWVGTYGAGISRFHNGKRDHWTMGDGLPNDTVWSLGETPDGTIWAGTYGGGLASYSGGIWRVLTTADGLATDLIRTLHTDRQGTLWIGTSGGLCTLDGDDLSCRSTEDGLTDPSVLSIYEDPVGRIWAGTNGGGVNLVTRHKIFGVTTAEGLFDDVIYRMLPDDQNRLWMSCNRGIFGVDYDQLLEAALHDGPLTYRALGRWDGMATDECNGGSQPAGWRASDGRMWFPTVQGVAVFDPRKLKPIPEPPEVQISEIIVDGSTAPPGTLTMPADANTVKVSFTATSFIAPERLRFRYRIADLDAAWTDAGLHRSALFSHLPPGQHRLEIVAGYADGTWSDSATNFDFFVEPQFHQTPEFLILCALALIAVGFGVASVRTVAVRRRERLLAHEVDERTSEILDVTRKLEEANRRLEALSLVDSLTGAANRRSFDRTLAKVWAQGQRGSSPVGLLMIDVDHFKAYNDTYGHARGDECLRQISDLLSEGLRRTTDLLARYGGEEFAVILPGCDAEGAAATARTLRERIQAARIPHEGSPDEPSITISVGAASTTPRPDQPAEALSLAADGALYRAKKRGRNRVETGRISDGD